MKIIKLTLAHKLTIPLEVDGLSPAKLAGMSIEQIKACEIWYGKTKRQVGDFFQVETVEGTPDLPEGISILDDDACLEYFGDLSRVKRIGQSLDEGLILVHGDAGIHLGAFMSGGCIVVEGSTGDWTGAHMSGGQIRVKENVGNFTGSGYWGRKLGMTGGQILIEGSAADMTGRLMRRGLITVLGDTGDFTAGNMVAGTVIVGGTTGRRTGAEMKRGTVILIQEPEMMPTFQQTCVYEPVFLNVFVRLLRAAGINVPGLEENVTCRRYAGDQVVQGKGEILICQS